jgi:hypothetical protein
MRTTDVAGPSGSSSGQRSNNATRSAADEINNNNTNFKLAAPSSVRDLFGYDSASLDPFNDMELKTINEFEELKNILNNHQQSNSNNNSSSTNDSPLTLPTIASSNDSNSHKINTSHAHTHPVCLLNSNVPSVGSSGHGGSTNGSSNAAFYKLDSFGLPTVSFVDLDMSRNKL